MIGVEVGIVITRKLRWRSRNKRQYWALVLLASLFCAGCATTVYGEPPAQLTERPVQPVSQPSPQPTVYNACQIPEDSPATRHTVLADIDYARHRAFVSQRVQYANRAGVDLSQIVMNVEPTQWPGAFALESVTQEQITLPHWLDGKRLVIDLPEPLSPGCETIIQLEFTLSIPQVGNGVYARKGYFGYTSRQTNLGHWLPTVAVYNDDGWVSREFFLVGEQEVLAPADWHVTVSLLGEKQGVTVVGPGAVEQLGPSRWRFNHASSRDFTLSLSHRFVADRRETSDGVMVELYTFAESDVNGAAFAAMDAAASSLSLYSDLFGAYPGPRFAIVEGDFTDGMEFSGLAFVGSSWFQNYSGTPASYLVLITVHEVAHQWWYASVGNDPTQDPWLDEALSTYSEYLFLEAHFPNLAEWWWGFRVDSFSPAGIVDSNVYEFDTNRAYINAVYLNGARMLDELRQTIGTDEFLQLLAGYASAGAGRIATPDLFWAQLTPEQWVLTETTRQVYLRNP